MKQNAKLLFILFLPIFLNGQEMTYPFQDDKLNPNKRAIDLINRMTLEEKVSQMQDVAPAIERLGIEFPARSDDMFNFCPKISQPLCVCRIIKL